VSETVALCVNGHVRTAGETCKICRAVTAKRYRDSHKEQIAEQGKKYVHENKEKRDQYYKDNAEKVAMYYKDYQKLNAEAISIKAAARYQKRKGSRVYDTEKQHKYYMLRRAMKLKVKAVPFNRIDVFERDNYICWICDKPTDPLADNHGPSKPSLDHVIPLSKGGAHTMANARCAHLSCNIKKGNKIYFKTRGGKIVKPLSDRGNDWVDFHYGVLHRIENYCVPQYGDKGNDHVSSYSAAECVRQAEKYLKRFGRNSRPGEEVLDMLKAAHFIQMAAMKLEEERKTFKKVTDCPDKIEMEPEIGRYE